MPCQCGTTAASDSGFDTAQGGCECGTGSDAGCECGSGSPTPSDIATNLERVVMELDKRVRKLEANR